MKEKKQIFESFIYNLIIGLLAIIAVILAVFDLTKGIQSSQLILLDNAIWIIFIIDYFVRLLISHNKKDFIISNIFDLIAILPFNSAFRAFRFVRITKLAKLSRLTKLTKFVRLTAFSSRCLKRCKDFFNTNGFKYMLIVTFVIIILGSIGIHFAEDMEYKDAIWWSFVTATTVGYGDISPSTDAGRIIACVLMLVGIGLIGSLTSTITSFFLNSEKAEKSFKTNEINNIKKSIENIDNLSYEDIDDICKVLKALKNK
ncbi:MAG: potassium channel family protein [Lachnospirales bacterium]